MQVACRIAQAIVVERIAAGHLRTDAGPL